MEQGLSEIVVLRPTQVFLSFLASQLPEKSIPTFQSLQTDNTAFVIKKHPTNEGTLEELERLYSKMFRYEISRWLGSDARNEIEKSFLDFLCCFKLEFHAHLIMLEPSLTQATHMLQLRPRIKVLRWLQEKAEEQEDLADIMECVTLNNLTENASVVIKNFDKLTEIKPFLKKYYKSLFATAMSRMCSQRSQWPNIDSFDEFNNYFSIQIHTHLISCAA
jgi:hypothetical protein